MTICDELWYIYASEDIRRERLKATRGYSDARIDGIFKSQCPEAVFGELRGDHRHGHQSGLHQRAGGQIFTGKDHEIT